jgi:hypothetical protein
MGHTITLIKVRVTGREELRSVLAEMTREGLQTASGTEPGWYWTSLGGTRHWVCQSTRGAA